jgi:hypothetical protein
VTPILIGVLDDRSRVACHLQWYLHEKIENIAHGLSSDYALTNFSSQERR